MKLRINEVAGMEKKNKAGSKNIWMYAVLLFTSAFVILILTAYSQMKLNSEKNNIASTLQNEIIQKDTYRVNLSQTLEENQAILNELNSLKQTNQIIAAEKNGLSEENVRLKDKNANIAKMYEKFIKADEFFSTNDWLGSAKELFMDFDITFLSNASITRCRYILDTITPSTPENAYLTGYSRYVSGSYQEAADLFNLSIKVDSSTFFSDDCYYLQAHSYMFLNDNIKAAQLLDTMIRNYPDSNLINEAKADYEKIK